MAILATRRRPTPWHALLLLSQVFSFVILLSPKECLAFTGTSHPVSRKQRKVSTEQNMFLGGSSNGGGAKENRHPKTAFIIERIGARPNERVYREIADMCINVFFKEQLNAKPEDKVPLWKETQISYLKTLQTGDLRRRRDVHPKTNAMFLAYEVKPAPNGAALEQPLLLDLSQVYNLPSYARNQDFVRGEVLGFCEITQRPYGLGSIDETEMLRTVLTNLAVSQNARELGIGSKLIDECERHVARKWKLNEIILEVEDYNTQALDFYAKRGYEIIFSDPASRRFDVSGLILRKVRCTRRIMRKVLTLQRAQSAGDEIKTISFEFFQQLLPKIGV